MLLCGQQGLQLLDLLLLLDHETVGGADDLFDLPALPRGGSAVAVNFQFQGGQDAVLLRLPIQHRAGRAA